LTIDSKTAVLDSRSETTARPEGEFKSTSLFKQNQTCQLLILLQLNKQLRHKK
jgi:hypothetical protein